MPRDRFIMSPYHPLPLTVTGVIGCPITLTLKDQRTLFELEKDLVEDTFRKYEKFVMSNSQVNTARWKHVKSKDDLHIYVKRAKTSTTKRGAQQLCQPTGNNSLTKPVVISVGTFKGQLDDLMFSTVNPTDDIMNIKASYVHDYGDGAVLATLRQEALRVGNVAPVLPHEDVCVTCNRDLQQRAVQNWWKDKCTMCLVSALDAARDQANGHQPYSS
ncbi:unnamed protein product [Peronospora destructor]|uniref:Uncharacterized protein n=1 Tax=Peronospora destructor TaxID=86335 RepID=A0AAV0TB04_9STRA|nr:unnamed protein product [Peronospora destructor]